MKRQTAQAKTQNKPTLHKRILAIALPVVATILAAGFVFVCIQYLKVKPVCTIELGSESPKAEAFLYNANREIAYAKAPESLYKEPGNYLLSVRMNGLPLPVLLRVRDRTAPKAKPVETTVSTKASLTPDKLVKNLQDASILKLTYVSEPDYGTVGDYEAIVRIEDQSGNATEITIPVHVRITVDEVTAEAGDPVPDVRAFLIDDYDAAFVTELAPSVMAQPGTYPIRILAEGTEAESTLVVRDTVAPTATVKTVVAKPDTAVSPEDFITNVQDETAVTATFAVAPDPDSRLLQTVEVRLTDLGGNETVLPCTLLLTNVAPFALEASDSTIHITDALAAQAGTEVTLEQPFLPDELGLHQIAVRIGGEENLAIIDVRDTIAPTLSVVVENWYLNAPEPASFFAEVSDFTETTVAFETEPDWSKTTQPVTVVATDAGGNEARAMFVLTLEPDVDAPILYGARDRYCYLNETVAYLLDVYAEDNCDGEVAVKVDASRVDPSQTGTYPVTYTATDRAGNVTECTVNFTIVTPKIMEGEAEEIAQKILKEILTDDMTLAQQIEAIYNYVFRNVHYVGRSDKTDWRAEAVRGLTTGKGDCFTYYASARLLLEHTDAEIMSVERLGGRTRHYWLLVNIGTGWYHFDACNAGTGKHRCFMWTNEQTNAVSTRFWHYDETLYPPVATERYRGGN